MKKQSDIINDKILATQLNGGSTEEVLKLWEDMKAASLVEIKQLLNLK